jgi:hypothetical protein
MATKNVTFGTYSLIPENGIIVSRVMDLHGPKRFLSILQNANSRGASVLRSVFQEKVIQVDGIIFVDSSSNFTTKLQEFTQQLLRDARDLKIENENGTFQYDGCYVVNSDRMVDTQNPENILHIPFSIQFIAPKGFCHEIDETNHSDDDITSFPHTDTITIDGTVNPEPAITDIIFTNQTTNTQISVLSIDTGSGQANDGDILVIDTANKTVKMNGTEVEYDGVFPSFNIDDNIYQVTIAGTSNIAEEQTSYDGEEQIYDDAWVGQQFLSNANQDISQIGLVLKRVAADVLALYDDFPSLDTDKWAVSGGGGVSSGRMRIQGTSGTFSTNGKTTPTPPGDPITGEAEWTQTQESGTDGAGGTMRTRLTNGTDYIEIAQLIDVHDTIIRLGGHYGSGDGARWSGTNNTISVKQVGSNIEIRANGSLKQTLSGKSFQANTHFEGTLSTSNTHHLSIDNVKFQQSSTANTDITVEINADDSGDPDGTPVTNGSLTIPASTVDTEAFGEIIKEFSTEPSLTTATIYHLVVYQTGGDTNNYYLIKKNSAGGYADGTLEKSSDGGTTWANATGDLYFRIWSTLPTSVDLDIDIDYYPSHHTAG